LTVGTLEYFDITKHESFQDKIHFYSDEKNTLPQEYESELSLSESFSSKIIIENFPLRGKSVLQDIERRRWTLLDTGRMVKRNWDLIANDLPTRSCLFFKRYLLIPML
jgi:hypothetical protein